MTVVYKPFVIIDIFEMEKAELGFLGTKLMRKPELDMFRIRAVLKSFLNNTSKGKEILKKIGLEYKLDELDQKYSEYLEAFTAYIPVTRQTLEWNKYHVGGEIMIAYYPTSVWATFHTNGEEDNNDDFNRLKKGVDEEDE